MEDFAAQFEDILSLGQLENEFDVPGREKTHRVRVGVLWNSDVIRIKDRAARRVTIGDSATRREIEIIETLVEAILSIDNVDFFDPKNLSNHDALKSNLRVILDKASPYVVTYIYGKYLETVNTASQEVNRRVEEIKKSSGLPLKETPQQVELS